MTQSPDDLLIYQPAGLAARIRIRPMRFEDLEQVHELDLISFTLPWPASAFQYELKDNPNSLLWVADTDTPDLHIVGMIVVWLILDEAHIATVAVHPDYQRRGIGARILYAALKNSIQRGARMATLEVRASNFGAQTLYQRFGFEVAGMRPRYYRDNQEDALLMTVDFEKFSRRGVTYLDWLENGSWISGETE